tara:strand:+ start:8107 stop:8682 length:576 start_codon:yes stop_codon:yes gene_type:complete
MATLYRKDPTLYGDNIFPEAFSTASTVTVGAGVSQWRDHTSHSGDGLNCLITQSSDYSSTGDNAVKMTCTGISLCKTGFHTISLVTGEEYEISFKYLIPSIPSTAEGQLYTLSAGTTAYGVDIATKTTVLENNESQIGVWIQAEPIRWIATATGAYFTIGVVADNVTDVIFLDEIYLRRKKLTYSADAFPT